jgi:hypothetical protein
VFGAVAALAGAAAVVFAAVAAHELGYVSDHPHAFGPAHVIAWGAGADVILDLLHRKVKWRKFLARVVKGDGLWVAGIGCAAGVVGFPWIT